jgi:hypothetical protein
MHRQREPKHKSQDGGVGNKYNTYTVPPQSYPVPIYRQPYQQQQHIVQSVPTEPGQYALNNWQMHPGAGRFVRVPRRMIGPTLRAYNPIRRRGLSAWASESDNDDGEDNDKVVVVKYKNVEDMMKNIAERLRKYRNEINEDICEAVLQHIADKTLLTAAERTTLRQIANKEDVLRQDDVHPSLKKELFNNMQLSNISEKLRSEIEENLRKKYMDDPNSIPGGIVTAVKTTIGTSKKYRSR